jgi:broad specificity phosphatase PhoE
MAVLDVAPAHRRPADRVPARIPSRRSGRPVPEQVIMLIRHAEKPRPPGPAYGISPTGRLDKRSLTVDGWQRAGALVELFAPSRGRPPGGLWRPDAVYASAARNGRSRRSIETVEPLARQLGVEVVDRFGPGEEEQLVADLTDRPGATLVSWHHKSLTRIIGRLGKTTPAPPRRWPRDRYDMVWVFVREGRRRRFVQVPQLLLPGDQAGLIAA